MDGKLFSTEEKALQDNINGFFGEEEEEEEEDFDSEWAMAMAASGESESNESSAWVSNEQTQFWESKHSLLQEMIKQYSLFGSKLRQEISRIIEMARETNICKCCKLLNSSSSWDDGYGYGDEYGYCCTKCLRQRLVNLLCNKGFNATLFKSNWKRTHKFPAGTHEYIEVIASTAGRKRKVPILIELEFRDELRMAKECDKYRKLIDQIPEIYIGKADHLNAIICLVCDAAKRSTAERKFHMGPWRNRSFMQMKWSASLKRDRQMV